MSCITFPTGTLGCSVQTFNGGGLGNPATSSYRWSWTDTGGGEYGNSSFRFADSGSVSEVTGNDFLMTGNVGLWHFEENALDSSGLHHHGTITGTPEEITGRVGEYAYSFNEDLLAPSSITIPGNVGVMIPDYPFAVSFWARCDGVPPDGEFNHVMVGNASNNSWADGWGTYWTGTNTFRFWINQYDGGTSDSNFCDVTGLNPLDWNHFVCVYSSIGLHVYVNGEGPTSSLLIGKSVTGLTNNLRFASMPSTGLDSYLFPGDLDEIALFNYQLTNQQISDIYFLQSGSCANGTGGGVAQDFGVPGPEQGFGTTFTFGGEADIFPEEYVYKVDLVVTGAGGQIDCAAEALMEAHWVDCLGTSCGSATMGCDGICSEDPAQEDCNGDCEGGAEVNECGHCVGGMTGLPLDWCGPPPPQYCKSLVGPDFEMNNFWNRCRSDPRNIVQGPFILGTNSIEAMNTNIGTGSYALTGTC